MLQTKHFDTMTNVAALLVSDHFHMKSVWLYVYHYIGILSQLLAQM